jgi:hypothetical protein
MFGPEVNETIDHGRLGIQVLGGSLADAFQAATDFAKKNGRVLTGGHPTVSRTAGGRDRRFFPYSESSAGMGFDRPITNPFGNSPKRPTAEELRKDLDSSQLEDDLTSDEVDKLRHDTEMQELREKENKFAAIAEEQGMTWDEEAHVWIDGNGNQFDIYGEQL